MADSGGEELTDTENLTDGFNLVIDALKLNDIHTIYNVPGIPITCLLYTSPSPRDLSTSRMPSSA